MHTHMKLYKLNLQHPAKYDMDSPVRKKTKWWNQQQKNASLYIFVAQQNDVKSSHMSADVWVY